LLSLRNLEIREILQLISGALAPLFLYGVYLNLYDMAHLIPNHFVQNLTIPSLDITAEGAYDSVIKIWLKPLLFILTIFMAIASHNSIKKKKKFDAIKKIELSYWMLFVSILSIFFINPISEKHLLILSIPLAIVSGLVMEGNKNRVVKEFVFLLLIATCVAFQLQII